MCTCGAGAAMRLHFSTDDLPPRDREPFWHDFLAKHVLKVTPTDRSDPRHFGENWTRNSLSNSHYFKYEILTEPGAGQPRMWQGQLAKVPSTPRPS